MLNLPNAYFQIAEMTVIPTGSLIQTHLQPSSQVVENALNS